jgi:hypothetical protein
MGLMPLDCITIVSFVDDKEPKAIRAAINTAIGPASVTIQAKFRVMSCVIIHQLNPLPTRLSMYFMINWKVNTKITIKKDIINGAKCAFSIYLYINNSNGYYKFMYKQIKKC